MSCLRAHLKAEVAELADARGSGPRTRKGVGVRVPSSAPVFLLPRRAIHLVFRPQMTHGLVDQTATCELPI